MTVEPQRNLSLEDMDRQGVLHPFTPLGPYAAGELGDPRIVVGGKGVWIRDQKGRDLLDAFGGLYCVNIGYGRSEVADAIAEQARRLAYYHAYSAHSNEPAIRLSDAILRLAPAHMSKVYYGLSGSDANETNAKIVWYYNNVQGRPEKRKIIARQRAYHGGTAFASSLNGLPLYHQAFNLPIGPVVHTRAPHHWSEAEPGESEREFSRRCAAELEDLIEREGPETVAALIGEPVLGTGGIVPPPEAYWDEIQKVMAKYDLLLIADEVVCGFGRIGTNFGSDHYGMQPDLMTVAKGLTSAYQPLSAAIVSEKVWRVLAEGSDRYGPFAHGYTYSAHPVCAAAGLANLAIVEREDLAGNARRTGSYLQERLREAFGDHPLVGEVRGIGLLAALEFAADGARRQRFEPALKVGARVAAAALEEGLVARAMPGGDILGFAPPLVITKAEVDEVVDRTRGAVDRVADALVREGAWRTP